MRPEHKTVKLVWVAAIASSIVSAAVNAQYASPNLARPTNVAPLLDGDSFLNPPANVRPKYRWWVTVADMEDGEIAAELAHMMGWHW